MNYAANSPEQLLQRYDLLCRALRARAEDGGAQAVAERLGRLSTMIHHELIELARMGSPDDFADIYLGFTRELERFHEFCADPRLAQKTVVAFGGPFSAGKSSLINALLGQNLLVVEVDPTTALPAYLFAGEADVIHAINLHGQRITLSADELASLTHDERHRYGSEVGRALSAAFVTRQAFPWPHIAFVDTPGYTGGATAGDRTDANLALSQLNGAHAIVWVASIKQGDFTEEDLRFLARLDPAIPRFIAVSHADLVSEEDRAAVVARMQQTLAARNLPALGVFPVSARPRYAALLEPLRQQIDAWNQPRQQRFAHRFKALFTRYQRGLEREKRDVLWQLHRINRLATLAEGDLAADAGELKAHVDARLDALKEVEGRLAALRSNFFAELKRIGDAVGIPLPEPHEIDLLESGRSNLLESLVALREKEGREEPDMRLALGSLQDTTLTPVADGRVISAQALPKHALADEAEHLRRHYALLLAATLSAQEAISEAQTRLFRLLLDALGFDDIRAALFDEARALSPKTLLEAARLIRASNYASHFLLDAMVLLRIEAPLADEMARLIAELTAFLGLDETELRWRVRDAAAILGLPADNEAEAMPEKERLRLAEHWPECDLAEDKEAKILALIASIQEACRKYKADIIALEKCFYDK